MSHHKDQRNTPELDALLRLHRMATDTPSQLSDAFRLGYWAAQAEIARLQAEVERTNDVLESQAHVISDLRAKLDTARNAALEDAALLANRSYGKMIDSYAIRSLKKPIDQ